MSPEALRYVLDNYFERHPARRRPDTAASDILSGEFEGRLTRVWVVRDVWPFIVKTVRWEEPDHEY